MTQLEKTLKSTHLLYWKRYLKVSGLVDVYGVELYYYDDDNCLKTIQADNISESLILLNQAKKDRLICYQRPMDSFLDKRIKMGDDLIVFPPIGKGSMYFAHFVIRNENSSFLPKTSKAKTISGTLSQLSSFYQKPEECKQVRKVRKTK